MLIPPPVRVRLLAGAAIIVARALEVVGDNNEMLKLLGAKKRIDSKQCAFTLAAFILLLAVLELETLPRGAKAE